jgi:hypothetical protein
MCIVYCGVINSSQFNVVIKHKHKSWKFHYLWIVVSHIWLSNATRMFERSSQANCWSVWWRCHEWKEYMHMHVHTYMQACFHACIHTYIHMYIQAYICTFRGSISVSQSQQDVEQSYIHKYTQFLQCKIFKHFTKQYYRTTLHIKKLPA